MTYSTATRPTPTTVRPRSGEPHRRRRRLVRAGTVLGSAALAAALLLAATAGLGIEVLVPGPSGTAPLGLAAVLLVALVAGLLGWAVLALLERLAPRRGRTVWTVGAVTITVLSVLAGPTAAATVPAMAVLTVLHLQVGACVVIGFRRSDRT